jgi:hypothetical protein
MVERDDCNSTNLIKCPLRKLDKNQSLASLEYSETKLDFEDDNLKSKQQYAKR